MKKVLLAVFAIVVIAGFIVAKMMYDKMQFKKKIDALATFEPPEDFTLLLTKENLKKEKAPIYDFRMQGEPIVADMLEVIKTTSYPEPARLAAMIVIGHLAPNDGVDPMLEMLASSDGRVSECASVFLQKFYQKTVTEKIRKVAQDKSADKNVRKNAYHAMLRWGSRKDLKKKEKLKRQRDEHLKALALGGLKSQELEVRKLSVQMLPFITFSWEAKSGEKSELVKVIEKVKPFLFEEDKDLVEFTFGALRNLVGNMGNPTVVLSEIIEVAKSDKKDLQLKGVTLISNIFRDEESASRKSDSLEKIHFLLESSEKEILLKAIEILKDYGDKGEDRKALSRLTESEDKEIAEAAQEAQKVILKREES
jgi:hypothetical protein